MEQPLISICLPHYNSMPYTAERLESLVSQTWTNWECLVMDSGSVDGSLEIIQTFAARDPRIQIHAIPKEGCYAAFNAGIEKSSGKYLYIATADDTLDPDGLAYMVQGLEEHPGCGVCHTPLRVIDKDGKEIPEIYETYIATQYFADIQHLPHIRRCGHDAWLSSLLPCVYPSVTQMLYRKEAAQKAGPFPTQYGPHGDFAWHLRIAALTDTLHLPKRVATWRMHPNQLTQPIHPLGLATVRLQMVNDNLDFLNRTHKPPESAGWGDVGLLYRLELFRQRVANKPAFVARFSAILKALFQDPKVWGHLHRGRFNKNLTFSFDPLYIAKSWMIQQGFHHLVETLSTRQETIKKERS